MHQALVLDSVGSIETDPLEWRSVETPSPKADQILIEVAACGVCRSNLHMIEGDWLSGGLPARLPIVPGHEVTGTVAVVGADVTDFAIGDRVGVQPLWWTCEECEYCTSGREELCLQRKITGEMVNGGYGEYMIATAAHAYRLPDGLDLVNAAPLFCPGITAYSGIAKLTLVPGQSVGVFGLGGVGHMAVQFAKLTGAEVVAVGRSAGHLEVARELGADRVVDASTVDPEDVLAGSLDAAINFAPSDGVAHQAIASVKRGGIVVTGVIASFGTITFAEGKTIRESILGSRKSMHEVLALASQGRVHTVVERIPMEKGQDALKMLSRGELPSRAVLYR